MLEEIDALHRWKKSGRGETMMSTFEYKTSHDKMFLEGYREMQDELNFFKEKLSMLEKLESKSSKQVKMLAESIKWHNLKENPENLPLAQEYEVNESTDHWKWYLVKTDYTDYKSCHYAICARILMPRYSDGVEEPVWKDNSGNDIGDEHVFEWRELD